MGFEYRRDDVEYLLDTHYRPHRRAMRRCHPRDLLQQVRNYCVLQRPAHGSAAGVFRSRGRKLLRDCSLEAAASTVHGERQTSD